MKAKFTLVAALIVACITQASAQWTNVNSNSTQELNAVAFSGANGVIGGIAGNILYSSDAGVSWRDSDYYPYDEFHAVAYASPTVVSLGALNNMYRSSDGGADFSPPVHYGTLGTPHDMVFTSSSNGYAIDDYCQLATTTNGGNTWSITAHPCGNGSSMDKLEFPTASIGYACGANGNVHKTTDGGATWAACTAPSLSTVHYTAMQFTDVNTGYIAGRTNNGQDTFVFMKTTDGGTTWTDIKYPLLAGGVSKGSAIPSFAFADANTCYLIYGYKIFKTTDAGATWALDYTSTVTTSSFNQIVATPNVIMAVGTNGLAARLGVTNTGIKNVRSTKTVDVYPNPATNTITLGSFVITSQDAFIEIVDVNGRIVKAEKINTNEVDISAFSRGMYFGKVINGDGNATFKFVKQ